MSSSSTEARPTLPSLSTLGLLSYSIRQSPVKQFTPIQMMTTPSRPHPYARTHKRHTSTSTSSSCTSTSSRSPSPQDTFAPSRPQSISPPPSSTGGKARLVPCPMEHADAVLVVPPPNAQTTAKSMLLFGNALQHVRNPQFKLAEGATLRGYKIMRARSRAPSMV